MIIDKNGNDISKITIEQSLLAVIAPILEKNFSNRRIMLIHYQEIYDELNEAVSKFSIEAIIVEAASHVFIPNNYKKNLLVPMFFLSSDMKYFYTSSENFKFFPFWLIAARSFPPNKILIGSESDINRKFNIACTVRNLRNRLHRIYLLAKILQKSTANNILTRMYKLHDFDFNLIIQNIDLTNSEIKIISDYYHNSTYFCEQEINAVVDTNFEIYTESYVNLVSESYTDYNFISEKSYKPILAGQIPIVHGSTGIVRMYNDLGFDMFYDIIDHNVYDNMSNWKESAIAIIEYLDNINSLQFRDIFKKTADRRKKNLEYLHSDKLLNFVLQKSFNTIKF